MASGSEVPFKRSVSSEGEYDEEHEAVVWVRRSDWERVTEREEFVGRLSFASRLPQYLGNSDSAYVDVRMGDWEVKLRRWNGSGSSGLLT